DCSRPPQTVYDTLGLKVHRMSEWLTPADRAEARRIGSTLPLDHIEHFTYDGLNIGEHAHPGPLRFSAPGTLDDEPLAEPIVRRYLEAALLTAFASRNLIR